MADETMTIEDQRMMELEQARFADEKAAEEASEESAGDAAAKPAVRRFINSGEAPLLLAFTGAIDAVQWLFDFIPYFGWILNVIIAFPVGFILYIWIKGKMAKGAPKKWYKVLFAGAGGSIIPIIPGYFGAIIWLILEDRQTLKKAFGKLGKVAEKVMEKIK